MFIFAYVLFGSGLRWQNKPIAGFSGAPNLVPIVGDYRLKLSFRPAGELWMVSTYFSIPVTRQLEQHLGTAWVNIRSLKDLERHVSLNTAKDALDFVRILTSPSTGMYLSGTDEMFEIQPKDSETGYRNFGRSDAFAGCPEIPDGTAGLVGKQWWVANRIPAPKVQTIKGGWHITRALVQIPRLGKARTFLINEIVSNSGNYSARKVPFAISSPSPNGWKGMPPKE